MLLIIFKKDLHGTASTHKIRIHPLPVGGISGILRIRHSLADPTLPAIETPILLVAPTPTETIAPSPIPPTPTPQTEFKVLDYSDCFAPSEGEGSKTFIEGGKLNIVVTNGVFSPCDGHEFSDFTFEADATLTDDSTAAGTYSILFRINRQN